MTSTRIVIVALTDKGRVALSLQKDDEISLRAKFDGVARRKIPFSTRNYLKTVSLFIPKSGNPERHEILGFKKMGTVARMNFYQGVKKSFKENGCTLDDFEVKFYDE